MLNCVYVIEMKFFLLILLHVSDKVPLNTDIYFISLCPLIHTLIRPHESTLNKTQKMHVDCRTLSVTAAYEFAHKQCIVKNKQFIVVLQHAILVMLQIESTK
jgi:hypothetical protein